MSGGEWRKPVQTILLRRPDKGKKTPSVKIELYPAYLWNDLYPGKAYRVRVDGFWHDDGVTDEGRYLGMDGVLALLGSIMAESITGETLPPAITPSEINRGTRVRIYRGDTEPDMAVTCITDAFKNSEGDWCARVFGYGFRGVVPLCQIMEIIEEKRDE